MSNLENIRIRVGLASVLLDIQLKLLSEVI